MEITLGVTEARKGFSELVEKVQYRGDSYIINRHSKPVAAIVPMQVYESWQERRALFFQSIREIQEGFSLEPDEAEKLAAEAIATVRAEKRKREEEGEA